MNKIKICVDRFCKKEGRSELIKEFERVLDVKVGQETRDGKFSLKLSDCIGSCREAHDISINGNLHLDVEVEDIQRLIDSYK